MKALKNLGQGIAGNLGSGKLRKAMGGLGKGMLMGHGGRMSNRELGRMLSRYMGGGRMKYEHGGAHGGQQGEPETADPFENFSFDDDEYEILTDVLEDLHIALLHYEKLDSKKNT